VSSSEFREATYGLVADANDPYTEVHVLDSRLRPVPLEHNLGRVDVRLPRGVYAVRFQAGHAFEERLAVLEGGATEPEVVRLEQPVSFAAAAPLPATAMFNQSDLAAAQALSMESPQAPLGDREPTGELLIFIRDPGADDPVDLTHGLTLFTLDGHPIWGLQAGRPGCHLRLPAGPYRLRLSVEAHSHVERAVWVCPGWRAALFMLVRRDDDGGEPRVDFETSSLLLAPLSPVPRPLDLADPLCRSAELALRALDGDRAVPPATTALEDLHGNPILLLLQGRLQLGRLRLPRPQWDRDFLRALFEKLVGANGLQADVRALGHELLSGPLSGDPKVRGWVEDMPPVEAPPLLGASWQALMRADRARAGVIRDGSLADAVPGYAKPAGPWLVWWSGGHATPPVPARRADPAPPPPAAQTLGELQRCLGELWDLARKCRWWVEAAATERFMAIDLAAAETAWPAAKPEWQRMLRRMPDFLRRLPAEAAGPPTAERFLDALMLPARRGLEVVRGLLDELRAVEQGDQLRRLAETGKALPALRRAHLSCAHLVLFDDFCQEVFLRALEHRASFRGETDAQLIGWLRSIGRQLAVNYVRRLAKRECRVLPDDLADRDHGLPSAEAAGHEEAQESTDWMGKVFAALRPEERDLLFRLFFRGETLAEIARTRGESQNTLNKRFERLRTRLRDWFVPPS
jgi:RNA polymerase sigma factor (sigma-70 family)